MPLVPKWLGPTCQMSTPFGKAIVTREGRLTPASADSTWTESKAIVGKYQKIAQEENKRCSHNVHLWG